MIMDLPAEGWYKDPYEQHEDRWFSGGLPTKLVRDAGAESYAEPPDAKPPYGDLVPAGTDPGASPSDLHRADEACDDPPYDGVKAADAAWRVFDQSSHWGFPGRRHGS
jgi:hypothetical protein